MGADGGLGREHQGAGAVKDGVGHVGDLGPGGYGRGHHRLEHLGGGDHRAPEGDAGADNALLVVGDVLQGATDTEIAPRHHDAVGRGDHGLYVVDGFLGLDLGHQHRPAARDGRPGPLDVGRGPDEGDGHGVDSGVGQSVEEAQVGGGGGGHRQPSGRQGDAGPPPGPPAHRHHGPAPVPIHLSHPELDGAITEANPVAGGDVPQQAGMVDDHAVLGAALTVDAGDKVDHGAVSEVDATLREEPGADLRPGQVGEDPQARVDGTDAGQAVESLFDGAVGQGEPGHVHTGRGHGGEHVRVLTGGPDGGDYLRPPRHGT
jgi:hypothetical protein